MTLMLTSLRSRWDVLNSRTSTPDINQPLLRNALVSNCGSDKFTHSETIVGSTPIGDVNEASLSKPPV
ncbi:Thiamine repressibleregulatory protein thi1 [Fusarium oxysporum f. sp. albedinis]|nr:Thiamine repressibleregulatory protein thi1 [Fusarium oxysporum f. sp. albedinis]